MCEPGKPPPVDTPSSYELNFVLPANFCASTWSNEGPLFQPNVHPPEQSSRLNCPSSRSDEPVHNSAGPLVCGAPTPSSCTPRPSITTIFFCTGESAAKMRES